VPGVLGKGAEPYRVISSVAGRRTLIFSLGAYQEQDGFPLPDAIRPQLAPAAPVLRHPAVVSFILVPWFRMGARSRAVLGGWDYPDCLCFSAMACCRQEHSACSGVLALGAQLFHLIGVEWPKQTIEVWFAIPVTTLSIAWPVNSCDVLPSPLPFAPLADVAVWLLPVAA
jgi:hypothetical protein